MVENLSMPDLLKDVILIYFFLLRRNKNVIVKTTIAVLATVLISFKNSKNLVLTSMIIFPFVEGNGKPDAITLEIG